jgi:CMP-2-keto-3-deoxyoctulosonic acid synthetase
MSTAFTVVIPARFASSRLPGKPLQRDVLASRFSMSGSEDHQSSASRGGGGH